MKKTIYHGSDHIIEVPIFHGGKPHNDYGYGFYCTESSEMAKEWAVSEEHDGYANCYELDLQGLKILIAEDNDVNWEIISAMLRMFGITTERAENGRICVEKYYSL